MNSNKTKLPPKGKRRITEKANFAIHEWYYGGQEIGTIFSNRGLRTFRGRQIN